MLLLQYVLIQAVFRLASFTKPKFQTRPRIRLTNRFFMCAFQCILIEEQQMHLAKQRYYIARDKSPRSTVAASATADCTSVGGAIEDNPMQSLNISIFAQKEPQTVVTEATRLRLGRVLREHRLYEKRYKETPDYFKSVHINAVIEKTLDQGKGLSFLREVRENTNNKRLDKIEQEMPDRRITYPKRLVLCRPPNPQPKLTPRQSPRQLSPVPQPTLFNSALSKFGPVLSSEFDTARETNSDYLKVKFPRWNGINSSYSKCYKEFKRITRPTEKEFKNINIIVSKKRNSRINNPLEQNEFYRQFVRKDSEEFTRRFVGALLEGKTQFTFNSYLDYFNIFQSRTATEQEKEEFLFRFFTWHSENNESVPISEIKRSIKLLCENVHAFKEISEYHKELETNLIKALIGKEAQYHTSHRLLKKQDFMKALELNGNSVDILFVMMHTKNPHLIQPQ